MATRKSFDSMRPDEIDLEVMNAFHLAGPFFSVSVQLSDTDDEIGLSFLLKVCFDGESLRLETLLEIPGLILSHVSPTAEDHVAIEVGGTTHFIQGGAHTTSETPEFFFNKLFHHKGGATYVYGERGNVCVAQGRTWHRIRPAANSFLRTMHGARNGPVHVAGDDGTLLRLSGDRWTRIPVDFNRSINAIEVGEDGGISIGCEDGYCFRYMDDVLDRIAAPERDFFSIREFNGRRYWGDDEYGLYVQSGSRLEPVRELGYGYAMDASSEFLVITGWREVFLFNGATWSGFEFGYDRGLRARIIDMSRRYL
jgi:hypothetical protein